MWDDTKCENCRKRGSRQFKIHEPGVTSRLNGSDEPYENIWTFCSVPCAKSFAAWMLAGGLTKMPKGWKVEEVKDATG